MIPVKLANGPSGTGEARVTQTGKAVSPGLPAVAFEMIRDIRGNELVYSRICSSRRS